MAQPLPVRASGADRTRLPWAHASQQLEADQVRQDGGQVG